MSKVLKNAFSVARVSFWAGIALSSIVGATAYVVTDRSIEGDARARFDNNANYAQSAIDARIKSYSDLLRGAASFLESSNSIDTKQFHAYITGLKIKEQFPAVDSINSASYVPESQRQAMLSRWENEHAGPDHAAKHLDIIPPGIRPAYLVIYYVEPDVFSPGHYGVDLLANPYFGTQLAQERDDGKIHTAGSPIPVLSTPNDTHLGMRVAIYRPDAPVDTVAKRRAAYAGSLGIAFSVPKLVYGVLDKIPIVGARMTLYDVGPHVDDKPNEHGRRFTLFDSRGVPANPTPALDRSDDVFSVTLPLNFNGRPWTTVYSASKAALYTGFDVFYPKLMMLFGFLASILLYALLYTLTSSRRAALELAREMTSELRESQSKLQLSHQKLRRLADHAYQIKELERKRIAREIHDELGQNLLALRIEAEMLATRTTHRHGKLHARARATLYQIDVIIKSVRQIINDLRPNVLDLGLSAAVEWQASQFQRRTGIVCKVHDDHGEIPLPDYCATAFFRILQESLTNTVRHANATHVRIELSMNDGWLSMTVRDNGCGLPPGGRNKFDSFGLIGIEERIVILGGTCTVDSEPGEGTTVTVSAPVLNAPARVVHQPTYSTGSAVI